MRRDQDSLSVRGLSGLLQHQQELTDAALAGAIGAEKYRERRQPDVFSVAPRLEILYAQMSKH